MNQAKVGLQLIIYGARPQTDLAGVLKEAAEAGYVGIEAGNLFRGASPEEVKDLFARTGLKVAGVHSGYGEMEQGDKLEESIAYLKETGSKYLICSGVAAGDGLEGYEKAAETFNRVGKRCQEEGLVFCYHNHAFEFEEFAGGVKGIHRLAELTDPELVKLCIDVYWVTIGKENPVEFIQRYKERAIYFHFKDGAPGSFSELGKGIVDLPGSLKAALEAGADWIICEQDRTDKEPKESIMESREYLRKLGL